MNTYAPTPDGHDAPVDSFQSRFNTQAGWEWYVESLAKVVGINSIDDLTKTYAWFDFKMANFTGGGPVYDGHDDGGECWAANFPQPPFYYYVDSCVQTSTDIDSPTEMHVEVSAEYYNTKKSHFDHDVVSRAIANGYQSMPHVFDQECSEEGVPYDWHADFECELFWELIGYN